MRASAAARALSGLRAGVRMPLHTSTPALRATAAAAAWPRCAVRMQSSAGGGGGGAEEPPAGMTSADVEHVRKIAEGVGKNVADGIEEMKAAYGAQHAEKVWMSEYYKHREHKYLVPALAALCAEGAHARLPSAAAKAAVFAAHVLRAVPERTAQYVSTLSMSPGMDIGLLLAVVAAAGTPQAKTLADRLAVSVRRSGNRALVRVGQHLATVPVRPVNEWPVPYRTASALAATWRDGAAPQPWEAAGIFAEARDALDFHDWLLVSSTTVVECLWAAFYATGDAVYVARLADMASDWAEWAALPDAVTYIANIEAPLPEELRAKGTTTEATARSVRAQVSRAAMWSLLHHTRRHPAVTTALAGEVSRLAPFIADAAARDDDAVAASGLTEADARRRLEVLPALLHLAARSRLDALDNADGK